MQDIFNDMDKVLAKFSDDMREMFKNYHREEVKEEVKEDLKPAKMKLIIEGLM